MSQLRLLSMCKFRIIPVKKCKLLMNFLNSPVEVVKHVDRPYPVPAPYPVVKNIPQPYPVEVIKHV